MNNSFYTFPALHGKQGEHEYYLLLCPLYLVPRIFLFDESPVPREWLPRPSLNSGRVERIAGYLQAHANDYVLAPLVASATTPVEFTATTESIQEIGSVRIPLQTILVVQDGQHRRAAIEELLAESHTLLDNTVPVMLFPDPSLKQSPSIFAALNQEYVQQNASRRVAHDVARPLAAVVRRLTEEVPIFQGRIDYEKTTISNRSIALFTMNAVFEATKALLNVSEREDISESQHDLALRFWTALGDTIPEWQRVIDGNVSPASLRLHYVHAHSVTLLAIGRTGAALIGAHPGDWEMRLDAWHVIDWSRQNPAWNGRAMLQGRMSKKHTSVQLTSNLLKRALDLPLTEKEEESGAAPESLDFAEDMLVAPVQIRRVGVQYRLLRQKNLAFLQHGKQPARITVGTQLR